MVAITNSPPALGSGQLLLYYAIEPLLEDLPVLIFYGPSTTVNSTQNSSRIQAHIYSLAGFRSFPRLTIAPTSPLYAAVTHLSPDLQGDELYRGLSVALLSYFAALPQATKIALRDIAGSHHANQRVPMMFDKMHAADLASRMVEVVQLSDVAQYLSSALTSRALSWIDIDVILPSGSVKPLTHDKEREGAAPLIDDTWLSLHKYGKYTALIDSLGEPAFLPTSMLQRAPSKSTGNGRTRALSRDQKISLRRELCELVDTENNYLSKIRNLQGNIATGFYQDTPSESWHKLFPESLDKIVDINESFRLEIQSVLDSSESEAIKDIDDDGVDLATLPDTISQGRRRDPTGVMLFSKAFLRWLPEFKHSYQQYMRSSGEFPRILGHLLSNNSSTFSFKLHEFGEQKLRSALIEPVQRLPRYSLFIDKLLHSLPTIHLAVPNLLKARDIITDICAFDEVEDLNNYPCQVLQTTVAGWPSNLNLLGRLITIVDVTQLAPPFLATSKGLPMLLLLFPGTVILIKKIGEGALSARGLVAELDPKSTLLSDTFSRPAQSSGLQFECVFNLGASQVTESLDGQLLYLIGLSSASALPNETFTVPINVLLLQAPYHGKATRLMEEIVKARIEERYPNNLRESNNWSLRLADSTGDGLGMLAAVTEFESHQNPQNQSRLGPIRLYVDRQKTSRLSMAIEASTVVIDCMTTSIEGINLLEIENSEGIVSRDQCQSNDIVDVLRKRLATLFQAQMQQDIGLTVHQQASFNARILSALPLPDPQLDSKHKTSRPRSPVKMLSNILGGAATQSSSTWKSRLRAPTSEKFARLPLLLDANGFTLPVNKDTKESSISQSTVNENRTEAFKSPLALLEDTFSAYMLALQSRSGNVVGKILQSRANADELAINELYNVLLDDPGRLETAALVSVDVLFAAFEKFLRTAWRERMGPLIAPDMVQEMQHSFDAGNLTIFVQHVRQCLEEMSPQNRRAFASTIKLLSDLLDASGNDGDRGLLIASFAEALVLVGNPHEHIMLLDRLVDDYDNLFGHVIDSRNNDFSAGGSLKRTPSVNSGSLGSNNSSLRRRWGLTTNLTRENSKKESESKMASVWRTLSKNAKPPGDASQQSGSLRSTLMRSKSTDTDVRSLPPSQSMSHDRPPTSNSMTQNELQSRPGSSKLVSGATSRFEEDPPRKVNVLKKKRRSSLSDLQNLKRANNLRPIMLLQTPNLERNQSTQEEPETLPQTPSSGEIFPSDRVFKKSPQRSGIPRFHSPRLKENSPFPSRLAAKSSTASSETVTITSYLPQRHQVSKPSIPTPRAGLSERAWPPNSANIPPHQTPTKPTQKMHVQIPQRLCQRLAQEQETVNTVDTNLQMEMSKIGEELSALRRPGSSEARAPAKSFVSPQKDRLQDLSARLEGLQTQLQIFTTSHAAQNPSVRADFEASLLASEKKARKLDELYKEANAENEALYDRFNDELSKILGRVRKGEGADEMRMQLKGAQTEVKRLKGENAKLKREVIGLKALLHGE